MAEGGGSFETGWQIAARVWSWCRWGSDIGLFPRDGERENARVKREGTDAIRRYRRALWPAEQEIIAARARDCQTQSGPRSRAMLLSGAVIGLVLWTLTTLALDASWWVVTGFWLGISGVIALWARWQQMRVTRACTATFRSAMVRSEAEVIHVMAEGAVGLGDADDDSGGVAVGLAGDRILFLMGPAFGETSRFPNTDFELIEVLDESDRPVELLIAEWGDPLQVQRRVPLRGMRVPEHLDVVTGSLEDLEAILGSSP